MPYTHGTYGVLTASKVGSAVGTDTVVVYIGTAPVGQLADFSGLVNRPLKISSLADAGNKLGASEDWEAYTLMEAVKTHFDSAVGNVGPIYVINVLDPAVHKKAVKASKTVAVSSGRGAFTDDACVVSTVEIPEKVLGTDFKAYFENGKVVIEAIDGGLSDGSVSVSYDEADPAAVADAAIVGAESAAGVKTGLKALDLLYGAYNVTPDVLLAPGWSQSPTVYAALVNAAKKINGHFDAFVLADIPLESNSTAVDTIAKAIAWKAANGYTAENSKVFWPMAKDAAGKAVHLSCVAAAAMQRVDAEHDGVPFESVSNKVVDVVSQYFGEGAENHGFDQTAGNDLNAAGITTAVFWGGSWRLWGPHTAAFIYGGDMDERAVFDSAYRMLIYITNGFQIRNAAYIDAPLDLNTRDAILNSEQQILDAYAARGALLGTPTVEFVSTENPTESIAAGDFVWHLNVTPAVPLKSATARVTYTDDGFAVLTGGEQ